MHASKSAADTQSHRIGLAVTVALHAAVFAGLLSLTPVRQAMLAAAPVMQAAATLHPQPESHLRADRTTQYQAIADVMAAAARAGVHRIGFVSDPTINH